MEKLQELLDKHKENLKEGCERIEIGNNTDGNIVICLHRKKGLIGGQASTGWGTLGSYNLLSLSDLLFKTPFLSLLEWKRSIMMYISRINQDYDGELERFYENNHNFHKINLALLESDKERVEYIEQNIL